MKTAIITSGRVVQEGKDYYVDNGLKAIIDRYLQYFGEITLFGMDGRDKGKRGKNTVKLTNVDVVILGTRNELLLHKANSLLKDMIPRYDFLILRVPSDTCDTAAKIAKKNNIPYFVEVVGDAFGALWYHSLKAKPFAFGSYFGARRTIRDADFALYVSTEYLQKRYPCKNPSVGVSDCVFDAPSESVIKSRLSYVEKTDYSQITLMNAAAIDVKYKGQKYIIKAIRLLNKKGIKCRFLIVGNGDKSYLTNIAKKEGVLDQIEFTGGVPHERVIELLDESDFYIQPSLTEAFGRSVVEGLSRGCVCIGSNVGGITELVDSRFLVRKKKERDIAKAILYYIKLPIDEKRKAIMRNFNHVLNYTLDQLNDRRNRYFNYVLESLQKRGIEN